MSEPCRVVLLASGSFALPALETLSQPPSQLVAVVTKPDRPAGRGSLPSPTPVKTRAEERGLEVLESKSGRDLAGLLGALAPDLVVVVDFGQLVPRDVFQRWPTVNLHPSLLPSYRGASPIQSAILNGDEETGVTLMEIDEELDHGAVISQRRVPVERQTYLELHRELALLGASLLRDDLPRYLSGDLRARPQDDGAATFCGKLTRDDGRLDWSQSTAELDRRIRALNPWPGTSTTWEGRTLKILAAEPDTSALKPGEVGEDLAIGAADGALRVTRLQLEGRREVAAEDFLRGYPEIRGALLGT